MSQGSGCVWSPPRFNRESMRTITKASTWGPKHGPLWLLLRMRRQRWYDIYPIQRRRKASLLARRSSFSLWTLLAHISSLSFCTVPYGTIPRVVVLKNPICEGIYFTIALPNLIGKIVQFEPFSREVLSKSINLKFWGNAVRCLFFYACFLCTLNFYSEENFGSQNWPKLARSLLFV